jgi:hypothetical protein
MTINATPSPSPDALRDSRLARCCADRTPWSGAVRGRRLAGTGAMSPLAVTALDTNDLGDPERNQP